LKKNFYLKEGKNSEFDIMAVIKKYFPHFWAKKTPKKAFPKSKKNLKPRLFAGGPFFSGSLVFPLALQTSFPGPKKSDSLPYGRGGPLGGGGGPQ